MILSQDYRRVALDIIDKDPRATWFNVSHGKHYNDFTYDYVNKKDNEVYLWVWPLGGELEVKGPYRSTDKIDHSSEFDVADYEKVFLGRYDAEQEMVSIFVPEKVQFYRIPTSIVNGLKAAFPKAEKLIRYNYSDLWG